MIIYLGGSLQIHNLEIKTQKELDEFNKNLKETILQLITNNSNVSNSSVEIEWEEKAGELNG